MKTSNHYFLTGVTGILGSHILYELIQKVADNNYQGHIIIPIRAKKNKGIEERFNELLSKNIAPDFLFELHLERIVRNHIDIIDFDLKDEFNASHLFQSGVKYTLIHCAASVNLGNTATAYDEIRLNNYLGTINLITSLSKYISQVSYISTAFSSGHRNGSIENSFLTSDRNTFRNPYEQFKAQTENELVTLCDAFNLKWQIIRPSIICGRTIDKPLNVIPKFLVFYLFGAFFHRVKESSGVHPIRITMNTESGLNLIPVDYASKAIVRALAMDLKELNIASDKCVPNMYAVPTMLQKVGWTNFEITDTIPEELNQIEKLYYKTVGPQLNHYLVTPSHEFDTQVVDEIMQDYGQPNIQDHYTNLVDFAIERSFNHLLN
jgi:nucleoside-diphosphate-sugar epimerase